MTLEIYPIVLQLVRRLSPYLPALRARSATLGDQLERALISIPLNLAEGATLASGYVYLKLLTNLFSTSSDPIQMDADALESAAQSVVAKENMKQVIADAKAAYKSGSRAA